MSSDSKYILQLYTFQAAPIVYSFYLDKSVAMVTIPYSVLRVINQKCITGCWLSIRGKDLINQIHRVLLVTWDTAWRQVLEYKRLPYHLVNSLRPRSNRRHFADDMFKCISLIENVSILIQISLKFVPMGPINNIPALVQIMASLVPSRRQAIIWTNDG